MGRKSNASSVQRVTHTNQLRPSKGYSAILVAGDGDTMNLSWDGTRWIGEKWDHPIEYSRPSGYLNTTYQGVDALETLYRDPVNSTVTINSTAMLADEFYQFRELWQSEYDDSLFEVKKWVMAGLNLAGRLTATVGDTGGVTDTLLIGPAIRTRTNRAYLVATNEYDVYTSRYTNLIVYN